MKMSAEALAAIDEARKHGATDIAAVMGGKHIKVYFTFAGKRQFTTHPQSGSDWRAPMNARRDVRRLLGVERQIVKGKKGRKRNVAPPRMTDAPALTPGRDCRDQFKMAYLMRLPIDDVWRLWWDGIKERFTA